ncbi:hypothetical protein NL489_27790, partial [Klebsiella pneumoniae]|nr:hypothetical protein [Klebsiella pneumoniae]
IVDIETPQLKLLCDIAETYGAAAKTSGAGGGDCGIAIIGDSKHRQSIYESWKASHIKPLPFHVYQGQ